MARRVVRTKTEQTLVRIARTVAWRLDYAAERASHPPVRNTSASSMQSPPTSAEATRVMILEPVYDL